MFNLVADAWFLVDKETEHQAVGFFSGVVVRCVTVPFPWVELQIN